MSNPTESAILLVGLAGTGKTNFLVGLDVILDNQIDVNGLVHSDHAPDRAYVQPLREQWHRGEELDHTSRQAPPAPHQLLVCHPASGARATFHISDLAGETFDGQFVTRSFPREFGDRVNQATGLILFVHCDHEGDHAVHEHSIFTDPIPATQAGRVSSPTEQSTRWSIEEASKQVKLVDLLQFIQEIRDRPLRIAVAISAWDLVENAHQGIAAEMPKDPSRFVAKRWPLLQQFLECNSEMFPFRIFGMSARGGGHTPEEIARLTSFDRARDRVLIVDDNHRSNDLTRPVRWLMGLPEKS